MNIVIYARFSSHSQNDQSIEGQLKVCKEFAERNGYRIIGEYIDRALSGTNDNRPEFQRMIADSSKRQFQAVLVYQLDRFARNRYDSATYKARLKKNDVRVLSARENISDDASGVLMEAVLEGMAEYYSVELSQKIKRGMALNAEKCLSTGGNIALGYKVNENKEFVIDEETAPIVKRIFEMYIAGFTMADIIRYLNENQVKTSRGNVYNKNSLNKILVNRRYCGNYTYKNTEKSGSIPRIIDDKTFNRVQEVMAKNKKAPARAKAVGDNYLLTTRLFCANCGAPVVGVSGTSRTGAFHQYYQCASSKRKKGCDRRPVKKAYIEDLVVYETSNILTPENIDRLARSVEAQGEKEINNGNLKRLSRLIKENDTATANLIKALEAGKAADVISAQIDKRQSERADLEAQLAAEKIQCPQLKYDQLKFFFERFAKGDLHDVVFRQALADTFIKRIEFFDDHLVIHYNVSDGQKLSIAKDEPGVVRTWGGLVELRGLEPLTSWLPAMRSPN